MADLAQRYQVHPNAWKKQLQCKRRGLSSPGMAMVRATAIGRSNVCTPRSTSSSWNASQGIRKMSTPDRRQLVDRKRCRSAGNARCSALRALASTLAGQ